MLMRMTLSVQYERMMDESGPTRVELELHATGPNALTLPSLDELARALTEHREITVVARGIPVAVSGGAR